MAQVQRRLVHKQFNSPIGLYSDRNVRETLDRELKVLSNGVVGINFDDPGTTKAGNLAKSAVLAALEEEEREKCARQGLKRVAWPPPPESDSYVEQPQQAQQPQPQQQQQQQQYYQQQQPQQVPVQQQQQNLYQPQSTQAFQPPADQYNGLITTLRQVAPISQKPAPVFSSQPAAQSFQGGINMRGDQKWPPAEYKQQSEVENDQRRKIAMGPAFRPKRVNKDYSQFFAQNSLNTTYTGYRAPPGTQHHGMSSAM